MALSPTGGTGPDLECAASSARPAQPELRGEPTRLYHCTGTVVTAERIRTEPSHACMAWWSSRLAPAHHRESSPAFWSPACYKPACQTETIFPRAMAGNGKEVNDGYVYLWSSTPVPGRRLPWTSPATPSPARPRSWAKQVLLVR